MYVMHSYSIPHKPIAESSESVPNRSHKSTIKRQYRHLCSKQRLAVAHQHIAVGCLAQYHQPKHSFCTKYGLWAEQSAATKRDQIQIRDCILYMCSPYEMDIAVFANNCDFYSTEGQHKRFRIVFMFAGRTRLSTSNKNTAA